MRLFQSSITAKSLLLLEEYRPDVKINALRSYLVDGPGTIDILANAKHCINMLILDSGTWSMNQGKHKEKISLKTYADFLKGNSNFYDAYFGFDPVHGDEGTEDSIESQIYLESLGFYPIPIIQNLKAETKYYCERKDYYKIVAIGSTRQKKFDDIKRSVNILYENGIKVHLFGIGSYAKLIDLPIWSSDCSSFVQWVANGRLIFFNGEKEISLSPSRCSNSGKENKDFIETSNFRDAYEDWICESFGIPIDKFLYKHDMKIMANSYYYWELEKKIQKIHLEKGFVFDIY